MFYQAVLMLYLSGATFANTSSMTTSIWSTTTAFDLSSSSSVSSSTTTASATSTTTALSTTTTTASATTTTTAALSTSDISVGILGAVSTTTFSTASSSIGGINLIETSMTFVTSTPSSSIASSTLLTSTLHELTTSSRFIGNLSYTPVGPTSLIQVSNVAQGTTFTSASLTTPTISQNISSTAASSETNMSGLSSKQVVAIGAGVGISLVLIAITLCIYLFLRYRQQRRFLGSVSIRRHFDAYTDGYAHYHERDPSLEMAHLAPDSKTDLIDGSSSEIAEGQKFEMNARRSIYELGSSL